MPASPTDAKRALREHYRALRAGMPETERRAQSEAVCERLAQHPACAAPGLVLAYWPLERTHELDLLPLLHGWARDGRLALPRVVSERGGVPRMEAVRVRDLAALALGRFGVMEPVGSEIVEPGALDVVVLPGLVVDTEGYRLGYGGGFYDAYLAAPDLRAALVFAGYDHALAQRLPRELHDVPAQHVVTPGYSFRTASA